MEKSDKQTAPNKHDQKQDRRLLILGGILAVLLLSSIGWYVVVFRFWQSNPSSVQTSQDKLVQYFQNEELKTQPDQQPPPEIEQRLEKQIEELRQSARDKDAAGENSYLDYMGIANSLRMKGEYEAALKAYQEMLKRWPDDYLVWHNIGVLYEDMGQYLSAARAYQKSIDSKPEDRLPYLKLAKLYLRHSSDPTQAREVYLRALQSTNNDIEVMKAYAEYLEKVENDLQEALLYWQEIVKRTKNKQAVEEKIKELEKKLGR